MPENYKILRNCWCVEKTSLADDRITIIIFSLIEREAKIRLRNEGDLASELTESQSAPVCTQGGGKRRNYLYPSIYMSRLIELVSFIELNSRFFI